MKSFAVRLTLETPIVLKSLLHLDGLLGAMRNKRGESWDDIPLAQTAGIWQGSAAILECDDFGPAHAKISRIKHLQTANVPQELVNTLAPNDRAISDMSDHRNKLTRNPSFGRIYAAWFVGRGNLETCSDLLSDIRSLGQMSRTGYGRVTDLETFELPDNPLSGLMLTPTIPARRIPQDKIAAITSETDLDGTISIETFAPPYWTGPKTACIQPLQIDLADTRANIHRLLEIQD